MAPPLDMFPCSFPGPASTVFLDALPLELTDPIAAPKPSVSMTGDEMVAEEEALITASSLFNGACEVGAALLLDGLEAPTTPRLMDPQEFSSALAVLQQAVPIRKKPGLTGVSRKVRKAVGPRNQAFPSVFSSPPSVSEWGTELGNSAADYDAQDENVAPPTATEAAAAPAALPAAVKPVQAPQPQPQGQAVTKPKRVRVTIKSRGSTTFPGPKSVALPPPPADPAASLPVHCAPPAPADTCQAEGQQPCGALGKGNMGSCTSLCGISQLAQSSNSCGSTPSLLPSHVAAAAAAAACSSQAGPEQQHNNNHNNHATSPLVNPAPAPSAMVSMPVTLKRVCVTRRPSTLNISSSPTAVLHTAGSLNCLSPMAPSLPALSRSMLLPQASDSRQPSSNCVFSGAGKSVASMRAHGVEAAATAPAPPPPEAMIPVTTTVLQPMPAKRKARVQMSKGSAAALGMPALGSSLAPPPPPSEKRPRRAPAVHVE